MWMPEKDEFEQWYQHKKQLEAPTDPYSYYINYEPLISKEAADYLESWFQKEAKCSSDS